MLEGIDEPREVLDTLLISLKSDCDASASVFRALILLLLVLLLSLPPGQWIPLPLFLKPLLVLLVDVREGVASASARSPLLDRLVLDLDLPFPLLPPLLEFEVPHPPRSRSLGLSFSKAGAKEGALESVIA
jgi:hypothetical protein